MLIFATKAGVVLHNSGTNSFQPLGGDATLELDSNVLQRFPGTTAADYIVYRMHDVEQEGLVTAIMQAGDYQLQMAADGTVMGVQIWPKLTLTVDKSQILADGVDTATLTAKLPDAASVETVYWQVDDGAENITQAMSGVATLAFRSAVAKRYVIRARSSTRYGMQYIVLEGR